MVIIIFFKKTAIFLLKITDVQETEWKIRHFKICRNLKLSSPPQALTQVFSLLCQWSYLSGKNVRIIERA